MKFKQCFLHLLISFFVFKNANADRWRDPSWREMIDSSDAIALVKYTSSGMYRAQAQILTAYKGGLQTGSNIWISGFTGRYGPYDSVNKGETFLVFLHQNELTEKGKQAWEERVQEAPTLGGYYEALKKGGAYYVWTPTSGDLRAKGNSIQYDLLQTTYYTRQPYNSLPQFETFLRYAIAGKATETFYQTLVSQIQKANAGEKTAQHLMMLQLTRYSAFHPFYKQLLHHKDPAIRFALAQLLGNIKGENTRSLLVALLDDKNSIVQGEAVRQLSHEPKEILGPILLRKLSSAGKGVAGPSNIMDPVENTLNGGQVEIIETLGKLHYTEAVPTLLPLLKTDEQYTFKLVLETLQSLDCKNYAPYLIKHLDKKTRSLTFTISKTIADDSLTECLPALMNYVSTHDRSKHPSEEYLVSVYSGLGHFTSDTVKRFLVKDFLSILSKDLKQSGVCRQKNLYQLVGFVREGFVGSSSCFLFN